MSTASSASPAQQPEQPGRRRAASAATSSGARTTSSSASAPDTAANRFASLLASHALPQPKRRAPTTLQVHLHGQRMQRPTVERILVVLAHSPSVTTVDITGGAELNPHFQRLVNGSLALERQVVLHCAPELLDQPAQRDTADFLAVREVTLIAPIPSEADEAATAMQVRALKRLNALGYGQAQGDTSRPGLRLHLSYRPRGPALAAPQDVLEAQVRARLREQHDLVFDRLHALVNMPIDRFAQELERAGQLAAYRELLERAFNPAAAEHVMCRELLSVDWDGRLSDCDFNRTLGLPLVLPAGRAQATIFAPGDLSALTDAPIITGEHCLGCTAGQGSGCGGALVSAPAP